MSRIVWITGRAASGKSTVIADCVAGLRAYGRDPVAMSDEHLLFQLKRQDVAHRHHYHPYGDHRFLPRDGYLFDEGLRRINADLLAMIGAGSTDIVLVELARGAASAVADVSYRRALSLIDPQVWAHSLVFRLDVSCRIQAARNRGRSRATPTEIMCELYADDDPESLTAAGISVHHIPSHHPPEQAAAMVLAALGLIRITSV